MTPRLSEDMPRPVQLIIDLRTKDFLSLHRELVTKPVEKREINMTQKYILIRKKREEMFFSFPSKLLKAPNQLESCHQSITGMENLGEWISVCGHKIALAIRLSLCANIDIR